MILMCARVGPNIFESLASPSSDSFCPVNTVNVHCEFGNIFNSAPAGECLEITEALPSLSKGKAAGRDAISDEHFLLGPRAELASALAPLFSTMIKLHYVPLAFTQLFILPIPKTRKGPYDDPSRYRGISISFFFQ